MLSWPNLRMGPAILFFCNFPGPVCDRARAALIGWWVVAASSGNRPLSASAAAVSAFHRPNLGDRRLTESVSRFYFLEIFSVSLIAGGPARAATDSIANPAMPLTQVISQSGLAASIPPRHRNGTNSRSARVSEMTAKSSNVVTVVTA
jgi:hypothetical protein